MCFCVDHYVTVSRFVVVERERIRINYNCICVMYIGRADFLEVLKNKELRHATFKDGNQRTKRVATHQNGCERCVQLVKYGTTVVILLLHMPAYPNTHREHLV